MKANTRVKSLLRESLIAEMESAVARTRLAEEQASAVGFRRVVLMGSTGMFLHGNVKRAHKCTSGVQS